MGSLFFFSPAFALGPPLEVARDATNKLVDFNTSIESIPATCRQTVSYVQSSKGEVKSHWEAAHKAVGEAELMVMDGKIEVAQAKLALAESAAAETMGASAQAGMTDMGVAKGLYTQCATESQMVAKLSLEKAKMIQKHAKSDDASSPSGGCAAAAVRVQNSANIVDQSFRELSAACVAAGGDSAAGSQMFQSVANAAKDMAGNPGVQMGALMGAAVGAAALLGKDKGGSENGNSEVLGPSGIPAPQTETVGTGNLNGNCASGLTWNASLNSCQTTFTGGVSGAPTLTQETDTSTKNSALVDSATADKLKVKGGGAETKDALANVGGNRPGANLSGGGSGASAVGSGANGGGQASAGAAGAAGLGAAGLGAAGVGASGSDLSGFYNPQSFGGSGEGAEADSAFAGGLDVNYINNPNGQAVSAGGAGSNGQVRRVNLSLKDFCTKYPTHGRCKVRRDPLLQ